jgi:AmiR/NasT family two-component response regulator
VAQLEAEIAQLEKALRQRQQTGVATGLLAQRFKISRQPARTLAVDDADDENGGVANPKLTIVKDQP